MNPEGVTSASLIIVILIGAAVGAAVGGFMEAIIPDRVALAIVSGFVATITAAIIRNELINRISGAGPDDFKIPGVVITFAIVASLAGSLAGHEILDDYSEFYSGVWIGTLAGLLSSLLMAMMMIVYYIVPPPRRS